MSSFKERLCESVHRFIASPLYDGRLLILPSCVVAGNSYKYFHLHVVG